VGHNVLAYGKPGGSRTYPDALVKLDLKQGEEPRNLEVTVRRGVTVKGNVLGPDGKPVAKALMFCRLNVWHVDLFWRFPQQVHEGRFEVRGCDPEKEYPVLLLDPINHWGAVAKVSPMKAETVEVRLTECGKATARILRPDGTPAAGLRFGPELVVTPGAAPGDEAVQRELLADAGLLANLDRHNHWDGPRTDAEGRITWPALIPAATYRFVMYDKEGRLKQLKQFTAESGKTVDLGDITLLSAE
jgi:hypothetical protein